MIGFGRLIIFAISGLSGAPVAPQDSKTAAPETERAAVPPEAIAAGQRGDAAGGLALIEPALASSVPPAEHPLHCLTLLQTAAHLAIPGPIRLDRHARRAVRQLPGLSRQVPAAWAATRDGRAAR